ncbi:hypothetical protein Pst134EB_016455 [Puccinia striiformis f. sp. tritici]|nr:hypothetical protein Pst134EB_016455 [Puccinia striiformis f. sp. tritici]
MSERMEDRQCKNPKSDTSPMTNRRNDTDLCSEFQGDTIRACHWHHNRPSNLSKSPPIPTHLDKFDLTSPTIQGPHQVLKCRVIMHVCLPGRNDRRRWLLGQKR